MGVDPRILWAHSTLFSLPVYQSGPFPQKGKTNPKTKESQPSPMSYPYNCNTDVDT